MIIYEVTVSVRDDLVEKYEEYMLERHIPEILETGHFSGAKLMRTSGNRYRIHYEAQNREALDEYLRNDAPRLRKDFLLHFTEGIEISREHWEVLQIF